MKKALTLVVTLAMLLSIIAALPAAAEQGEATEIVMWGIDPLAIGSGHQEMIDHFNKTHPDINLVAQSTPGTSGYDTQDLSKLTAAIAAGNPPDVMYLNAPFILEVAARGVLEPLTGLIEKAGLDMDATY
ncbi:MAG: extracellular solute-binding protein, partial [Clostridiales bacterium]|nr:extracellular solute-binding protein [Clostridiales bacterium]